MLSKNIFSLRFLLLFFACTSIIAKPPHNLATAKEKVENYYECGQYEKDLKKIVRKTIRLLGKVDVQPNSTLIFDIDDTLLDNYCHERSIHFGYIPELFDAWVDKGNLKPLYAVKKLYDYAVKRGFCIIFITGRKERSYIPTVKNLHNEGFGTYDRIIMRTHKEHTMSAQEYKSYWRYKLCQEGYDIVANIGDQWSDLKGGNSGIEVKLPNARYIIL